MSKETVEREPFEVNEDSFDFLDVNAESDVPPEESSPLQETVEVATETDVEEGEEETAEAEETDTSSVEEDKPEEVEEETEKVEPDKELLVEQDGKVFDFTSAPKEMREAVKANNKLVNAFVRDDIEKVTNELRSLSPSSYANLESSIVQKSAEANPDKWAEYLVSVKPEMVKEALLGADLKNVNLDVLTEIARIYQEDSDEGEELRTTLELRNPEFAANAVPKLEPALMAELEEYRKKEKESAQTNTSAETGKVFNEVFDYVEESAVVPIVKQFGFMPEKDDSPETALSKKRIVNSLASTILDELATDPDTKDDYAILMKKVNERDKPGAIALTPSLIQKAEEIAISFLGSIKNQQTASLVKKHTPAKKPPTALAAGKTVAEAPKPLTLAQRLENQSDDEILRAMGL